MALHGKVILDGHAWGIGGGAVQTPGEDPEPVPAKILHFETGPTVIEVVFRGDDWTEFQRQVAEAGGAGAPAVQTFGPEILSKLKNGHAL